MKKLLYILICILCVTACQNTEEAPVVKTGTLDLTLYPGPKPALKTRAGVDDILAISITRKDGKNFADGRQHIDYPAGSVPKLLKLEEGTFIIHAYSQNQSTWRMDNDGKGSACFVGDTEVTITEDATSYCIYEVPMINYAVTLTLPELFHDLFTAYTFTVTSGNRTVSLREGEKAFFSPGDAGFTYRFSATNIDGDQHSASAILFTDVQRGKLYNLRYSFASGSTSGGINIDITDNTITEDTDISL
jgi:hypothetical protein